VILDDYSHFVWTFPLRHKSDVSTTLASLFTYVSTQFGRPIHALQTDNDKEFDNITIRTLVASHGTVFRLTCPYTSQQNGHAERILRTLNDYVRTLLFHAYMPPRFWPDALATATILINIRPCRSRWHYAPHHLLFGAPPSYDDLRIFGCRCNPSTAATAPQKLAPLSLPCVFLALLGISL
jgi:histone deacetylase 1/2